MSEQRYRKLDRKYRRALRLGLVLSLLAHAALFLLFDASSLPPSPFAAAGERRGDIRAAAGGGMHAIDFRAPQESRPTPTPVEEVEPAPTEVEPPERDLEEVDLPTVALADRLRLPGASGPLRGPGRVEGTGLGDGGTEAEGRFRVVPPRPRGMILPPSERPDDVRGREVEVWVFVNASGKVVPDSTRLNPSTGDRGFDRRLREHASGWVFEAARDEGRPVAEWFRYTIVM